MRELDKHRQYIRKEFKMDTTNMETVKENSNPNEEKKEKNVTISQSNSQLVSNRSPK